MLAEIKCDLFKTSDGSLRSPIVFHKGLNVVNGGDVIDNSIGKSTVLQIVDYAFGGDYYPKSEAAKKLGNHKIYFTFIFNDESFYFFRETENKKQVFVCDSEYAETKQIKLEEFRQFLLEKYEMQNLESTFRNLVTVFQRFSGRMPDYKNNILDSIPNEKIEKSISRLEMLFGEYSSLKQMKSELKNAEDKASNITKGRKLGNYDSEISRKKDLEASESELQEKKDELERLKADISIIPGKTDIDLDKKALIFRNKITVLKRRLTIERDNLEYLKKNLEGETFIPTATLNRLTEFFHDADIEKLEAIENFHVKISEIMKTEFEQEKNVSEQKISAYEKEIKEFEDAIEKLGLPKTISSTTIEDILELQNEINSLSKKIEAFKNWKSATEYKKTVEDELNNSEVDVLTSIEDKINLKVGELGSVVFGIDSKFPELRLYTDKKYEFKIDGDDGDGTSLLCTLIFDIAILELTKLPMLIHDTRLSKEANKVAYGNIINLYEETDKQIFIAFDDIPQFEEKVQKAINEKTVINLDGNNPLFGEKWNLKGDS